MFRPTSNPCSVVVRNLPFAPPIPMVSLESRSRLRCILTQHGARCRRTDLSSPSGWVFGILCGLRPHDLPALNGGDSGGPPWLHRECGPGNSPPLLPPAISRGSPEPRLTAPWRRRGHRYMIRWTRTAPGAHFPRRHPLVEDIHRTDPVPVRLVVTGATRVDLACHLVQMAIVRTRTPRPFQLTRHHKATCLPKRRHSTAGAPVSRAERRESRRPIEA